MLKLKRYSSDKKVRSIRSVLKLFGQVLEQDKIEHYHQIIRKQILNFIDICRANKNKTINNKLSILKDFLEWLGLGELTLIRNRDFLKVNQNDADWLDEITRQSIKQHLAKIPALIARHYLVKENILDANGQKPHFTGKITRSSRLQEVRTKYGMEAAQLYADHKSSTTTFQHYAPPTSDG